MKIILTNDLWIISLILVNAIVLFIDSFDSIQLMVPWLDKVDLVINILFFTEMIIKIKEKSWDGYIRDSWNKMDFVINLFLIPSLILFVYDEPNLLFITVIRLIRIIKFFRFFKFIPNIDKILNGVSRALKASVFIMLVFFLYMFIVSIISCFLFKGVSPEHFGNPLVSLYSTFKIFTVEGWYELPEMIAQAHGEVYSFFVKMYFIFLVLSGGIFGISIINAIFVDEMVADNNDELLLKMDKLLIEIEEIKKNIKN